MEELTPEEQEALKELAQNFIAAGRVGRMLKVSLLWLSGILTGSFVVWNAIEMIWGKH